VRPIRLIAQKALIVSAFLFWGVGYVGAAPNCDSTAFDETATVDTIYDGDTIKLRDGRVVRFIGINTPELSTQYKPAQPFAAEAKQALLSMLPPGAEVGLRFDQDRQDHYKRTLAHVYDKSGKNLSVSLLEQGLAFAIVVPPNNAHVDCYFANELPARSAKRGLWSSASYQPRAVTELNKDDTGFQYVEGRVTHIGHGKKNTWLDMGDKFSVRIQEQHLHYFDTVPIDTLKGKVLRVRGWVAFYNDKLRINIGHPAMIEIVK
jgi:endonuclease YncB( thermonuclease family)